MQYEVLLIMHLGEFEISKNGVLGKPNKSTIEEKTEPIILFLLGFFEPDYTFKLVSGLYYRFRT